MKTLKQIRESVDDPHRAFGDELAKKHGAKVDMHALRGDVHLANLIVPKERRKQGVGSAIMKDITKHADEHKKRVTLDLGQRDDHHGTTSSNRLRKFYKGHGFVDNKGRKKDFSISAHMYRDPK